MILRSYFKEISLQKTKSLQIKNFFLTDARTLRPRKSKDQIKS